MLAAANILGLKVNLIFAGGLLLLSVLHFIRYRLNVVLFSVFILLIVIKVASLGFFGLKELLVVMFGPLIFAYFTDFFDKLGTRNKYRIFKLTIVISASVCLIVVLQDSGILPHKIGAMTFVNATGYDISGEFSGKIRPSAYLYHPYDTALAMVPFLSFLMLHWLTNKARFFLFVLFVLFAVYSLGLKVLYIYVFFCLLFLFFRMNEQVGKKAVYACIAFWVFVVVSIILGKYLNEYIGFSAGRFFIWDIMLDFYLQDVSAMTLLFGYNQDILSNHPFWDSDETYTTHNQYLYLVIHLGWLFTIAFIYLLSKVLDKGKMISFFILLLFCSFALTGDLFVFLTCWVCLCQLYVIGWKISLDRDGRIF